MLSMWFQDITASVSPFAFIPTVVLEPCKLSDTSAVKGDDARDRLIETSEIGHRWLQRLNTYRFHKFYRDRMSPCLMYTLDFETIRQMMQAYQQTGVLSAEAPLGVGSLREPCRIEIDVMSGVITSCTVVSTKGRRLTGKEAVEGLFPLGRLRWTFTPREETIAREPSLSAPGRKEAFPLRTNVRLEQGQMGSFSRLHRAVFALADGTKSTAKIAEVLSTSRDLVDKALQDLQSIGVITFARQDRKDHR